MTTDEFWNLVEEVQRASGGNMEAKCELLEERLGGLDAEEVRSFIQHFTECEDRAYTWGLWAAAYIIGRGCSDDSFWDFRSTLISMGREIFEQTLANPESLADINYDAETAFDEGYQYVAYTVYEEMTDGEEITRPHPHPAHPSGQEWDENKVAEVYPKLAEHYKY